MFLRGGEGVDTPMLTMIETSSKSTDWFLYDENIGR